MVTGIIVGIVVAVVVIFAISAIRIVPEYERIVIFRLGRAIGARGPGLVLLLPAIDRGTRVDLREHFFDVPPQTCITEDNAPVSIDLLIYMRVADPLASVLKVQDFSGASRGIAITTLRAVVGDISLDDVLAKRDQINQMLQTKLDEVTDRWGVKVTAVEIREITPPRDIQDAMTRQMSAERSRRATVTEADGQREAAIKVAEGNRQAAILKAEGDRQAAILSAQGEREASILKAQGFALALQEVFNVAKTVDNKTMSLQYLEALRALGGSPATKFVFPMEFSNLLRPFTRFTGGGDEDKE